MATLLMTAVLAWGETAGWPILAAPLERQLSRAAQRTVRLTDPAGTPAAISSAPFSIRFLGGLKLHAPAVWVAAPEWSQTPYTLRATALELDLRYIDVWRAYQQQKVRGQAVRIERLQASQFDARLERLADGRASWQLRRPDSAQPAEAAAALPSFGSLKIASGSVSLNDAVLDVQLQSELTLTATELLVKARGQYKTFPVVAELKTAGAAAASSALANVKANANANGNAASSALPVTLRATLGRAKLSFDGSSASALSAANFAGRFEISGPSLAAVGDPVGVTLPTTAAFRSQGRIVRRGETWHALVDDAVVGASRLNGAFVFETRDSVRKLSGRLGGSRLLLSDLGPAIGGAVRVADNAKLSVPTPTKVLPSRPFDLRALRAMDANVLIDINDVDLNTTLLEPLRPLHVHLQLTGGVLSLTDLQARTAQGELRGAVRLDGRNTPALWSSNLNWSGVRLEQWVIQKRANGSPPWVSGRLNGEARLQGEGRSTAEILASLKGRVRTELFGGTVSHLAVEAAGLDIAQGLGIVLKGDDALPVRCGVADLMVDAGRFKPRLMVVDTIDSSLWVEGALSLATEALDLRVVVLPKDFSPLALRTPLLVRGSFSKPEVTLEKAPLARKLGASVLLGLLNPLAALIPFIDTGDAKAAEIRGGGGGEGAAPGQGCSSFAKLAGSSQRQLR